MSQSDRQTDTAIFVHLGKTVSVSLGGLKSLQFVL